MQSRLALAIAVFLVGTFGLAQSPLPPAPHRHVVTISPPTVHGNEPSIAVNPNNPQQVIAAFQPATIAYSADGGQTFAPADLPPIEGWRGGGDVSVAYGNNGNAYLATLHFDKLGSASYWGHGAGRNGIFVRPWRWRICRECLRMPGRRVHSPATSMLAGSNGRWTSRSCCSRVPPTEEKVSILPDVSAHMLGYRAMTTAAS